MADQILITEDTLGAFRGRWRHTERVATQFIQWLTPLCFVGLTLWVSLYMAGMLDYTEEGFVHGGFGAVVCLVTGSMALAFAVMLLPIYRMRQKAREALQLIETIRERQKVNSES